MARGRKHTAQFKAKVSLEAVKSQKTGGQLSSEFQVHPTVINRYHERSPSERQTPPSPKPASKNSR
uniref:Transposase n=1 Tax=Candidatus Kentrum sp. SD TaxID=2126332 RepID=A0A451BSF5_9GAMM|nr:MAG: hypothetical protein BECKSD772D_GA0070982_12591 [Candidatus Kentron sp. SD]